MKKEQHLQELERVNLCRRIFKQFGYTLQVSDESDARYRLSVMLQERRRFRTLSELEAFSEEVLKKRGKNLQNMTGSARRRLYAVTIREYAAKYGSYTYNLQSAI